MIKIKQTGSIVAAFCLLVSMLANVFLVGTPTAHAYTCSDPKEPTAIYEYHESDGMCWKVRYTDRQQNPPVATCKDGSCTCPNNKPFVLNGQCQQSCSGGDQYHADNNSCWYQNGYTDKGGQVEPTNNDGTQIAAANSTCTDGFIYMPNGNGSGGPGCYDQFNGSFPCGADQDVVVSGGRGGVTHSCGDAVKEHLVPKDKNQSADKTKTNSDNKCEQLYSKPEQAAQLSACQSAASKPDQDCTQQPNQEQKDACEKGKAASTVPRNTDTIDQSTGTSCGEAVTVLINCKKGDTGVQAIGDVLRIAVSVLSVIIGIAAVGGLAWSAILYAKAEDNQSNVSEARQWIRNIVIGILVYGFMVAIVNWLVPGGVIST